MIKKALQKVALRVLKATEIKYKLEDDVLYPERMERRSTPEYKHNHDQLVHKDGIKCFMCEMMEVESDPAHPLETHHIFEHSEENSMDFEKMQRIFDKGKVDFHGYSAKLKGTPVTSVDDIRNLIVMCKYHHIMKGCSAHRNSFAMFFTQMVAKTGVEILKGAIPRWKKGDKTA